MVEIRYFSVPAPEKKLTVYVPARVEPSDRPVVFVLHGGLRTAANVADWMTLLAGDADVILVDLPGHGRSEPLIPATLEALSHSVRHAIRSSAPDRRVIVVGESLGGLVALNLAAEPAASPVRAVIACDPQMSTAKLWQLQANLLPMITADSPSQALVSLAWEVFGVAPDRVEERIYYPLLDRLRVPTMILAGDTPLYPRRSITKAPCVFDEVDKYLVRRFYAETVELREVANSGHLLLTEAPEACLAFIREAIARHARD